MSLVLKVMLVETESGAHGEARIDLRDDAVKLTRTSFLSSYCAPAVAHAWTAMAKDAEERKAAIVLPRDATVQ